MRVKGQPERVPRGAALLLAAAAGLGLGLAIAWTPQGDADPAHATDDTPRDPATTGGSETSRAVEAAAPELGQLQVTFRDEDWQTIVRARERALADGIIVQRESDIVPVQLQLGEQRAEGRARLKGDWTDHVDTEQWSLRFELKTPIDGMRRFSIQNPKTRGFVMEWLVNQTAHRLGVLAPRCDYVTVRINGVPRGLYYLEEHFAKELLESQGRRDGPIVRFDESSVWSTWLQHGFHRTGRLAPELARATSLFDARAEAFGEQRLYNSPSLNARLQRALLQARQLQLLAISERWDMPARRLLALETLAGRTVEELFHVERLGSMLALYTLYGALHGLGWHQYRMYHDPVLDRLEPIVFDTGANFATPVEMLAMSQPDASWFRASDQVVAAAFVALGEITEPAWIEGLIDELQPRLEVIRRALNTAINLPGIESLPQPPEVLRARAAALHEIARPQSAAAFAARVVGVRLPDGTDERAVEVRAWATTQISAQVSGFRFGNGRVVRAEHCVLDGDAASAWRDGAVLLPRDGRRVTFRFPVDRRLAGLADVEAIKRAIRQQTLRDPADIAIEALFRPVAEKQDRSRPLMLRRSADPDLARQGRPEAPTLEQALARYPFLEYDIAGRRLVIAGAHDVDGDLVTPSGLCLHLEAGAELRLLPGAVVLCDAIVAIGAEQAKVRLLPQDPTAGFGGLQVTGGAGASELRFVEVVGATGVARGGWQSSGGVTFYGAPVQCSDCRFADARGEDSLNVVRARVRLERCVLEGGPHDLFDGDFVDGEVVGCVFRASGEDAVDVSGSTVTIDDCTFERIGDKALSIGEGSRATARRCRIVTASIAACAKDASKLVLRALRVEQVEQFVLAAYEKKPAFGPAEIEATGLSWSGAGDARHLAQTRSSVVVDGVAVPTEEVDVERLYREGILGK